MGVAMIQISFKDIDVVVYVASLVQVEDVPTLL